MKNIILILFSFLLVSCGDLFTSDLSYQGVKGLQYEGDVSYLLGSVTVEEADKFYNEKKYKSALLTYKQVGVQGNADAVFKSCELYNEGKVQDVVEFKSGDGSETLEVESKRDPVFTYIWCKVYVSLESDAWTYIPGTKNSNAENYWEKAKKDLASSLKSANPVSEAASEEEQAANEALVKGKLASLFEVLDGDVNKISTFVKGKLERKEKKQEEAEEAEEASDEGESEEAAEEPAASDEGESEAAEEAPATDEAEAEVPTSI